MPRTKERHHHSGSRSGSVFGGIPQYNSLISVKQKAKYSPPILTVTKIFNSRLNPLNNLQPSPRILHTSVLLFNQERISFK
jgi:hypothetical protein